MAFGQMGMRYEDFWYNYTLREFWNAIDGYYQKQETLNREGWEQTRIIYTGIINKPVYGYKIKQQTPSKAIPFPWDDKGQVPEDDILEQLRKETWGQER